MFYAQNKTLTLTAPRFHAPKDVHPPGPAGGHPPPTTAAPKVLYINKACDIQGFYVEKLG